MSQDLMFVLGYEKMRMVSPRELGYVSLILIDWVSCHQLLPYGRPSHSLDLDCQSEAVVFVGSKAAVPQDLDVYHKPFC